MSTTIKNVLAKRGVFTKLKKAVDVRKYVNDCVNTGSDDTLYAPPAISTVFYGLGTTAGVDLKTAEDALEAAPTDANKTNVKNKIVLVKNWLEDYSDKVEVIANDPANRTTREEAKANIQYSFLTSQKLASESKGTPKTPLVSAGTVGKGKIDAEIINGADYIPNQTTFIAIEKSALESIQLINGDLKIVLRGAGDVVIKSALLKGKFAHFTDMKSGVEYAIYAYAQNGKKNVSDLSEAVYANG
jgi:hypothetical protein